MHNEALAKEHINCFACARNRMGKGWKAGGFSPSPACTGRLSWNTKIARCWGAKRRLTLGTPTNKERMKKEFLVNSVMLVVSIAVVVFGFRESSRPASAPASKVNVSVRSSSAPSSSPAVSVSPSDVRAVYLTAAVASSPKRVGEMIGVIKSSGILNAVVINIKDGDGTYVGAGMKRIVRRFLDEGIYPIARIVVFQDNALAALRPDLALRTASGTLWTSGGGAYRWVDPSSREVWDRTVKVAEEAFDEGFREVNFDYVRFPSEGNVAGIAYPVYDGKASMTKVIGDFFDSLTAAIRRERPGLVLSVDLFAYSFINDGGLGVGQRASDAARYFDVVSPMVYPSHYASGNFGFENPAEEPYRVVLRTLESGKKFLPASSTLVIRPWIQDFNLGAVYDRSKVQDEIRAIKDAGFGDTWMAWNPDNRYDPAVFSSNQTDQKEQ